MLHLKPVPNNVIMYSLNSLIVFKGFTLEVSRFHILGLKAIKLLSPYFDLRCLTRMLI